MVQILSNNEKRSFLEQILSGANEAIPGIQKHLDTQNRRDAMEKAGFGDLAGLDPDLAKALAVERLKGQRPEKPLTSLQQSQEELNRFKLKQAQAQEALFNKFKGKNQQQQESTQNEPDQSQSEEEALAQWPIDELKEIAAFKGQPGQQGILGNIASNEIERREKKEKEETRKSEKQESEITESFKINKPYIDQVNKAYKGTKEENLHLSTLEKLKNSKKLTTPLMYSLLGKLGIPLGVLNNPDSELFEKTAVDLTKNVKEFYGSRPTNLDVSLYLRSIPTLENSDEGKQLVIDGIRLFKEPRILEHQVMNEILDEFKGKKLPLNLEGEVQKRMESKYDELMEKIKYLGRQKVLPGTQLNENAIDKYLEISGGDPIEAEKMAKEDGYVW